MEVYYRRVWWLGLIFILPALWFSLSLAGYTSQNINRSETIAAYAVIGVCFLVALQCFMGSTRFYFDNVAKAGIQTRKHFYGKNIVRYPYSGIANVTVRCYRRGKKGTPQYRVGINQNTKIYGQNAVKFTELRSFGGTDTDRSVAREFAKQISTYTKLTFFDDSDVVRAEFNAHHHS